MNDRVVEGATTLLLSPEDVDDLVLVDVLEDVGRVHEDADGADRRDDEEEPQLEPIHHHRDELPVFPDLEGSECWRSEY